MTKDINSNITLLNDCHSIFSNFGFDIYSGTYFRGLYHVLSEQDSINTLSHWEKNKYNENYKPLIISGLGKLFYLNKNDNKIYMINLIDLNDLKMVAESIAEFVNDYLNSNKFFVDIEYKLLNQLIDQNGHLDLQFYEIFTNIEYSILYYILTDTNIKLYLSFNYKRTTPYTNH